MRWHHKAKQHVQTKSQKWTSRSPSFCHVGQDIRYPASDAQNWHSCSKRSHSQKSFSVSNQVSSWDTQRIITIPKRCESATSPLKQIFHMHHPQNIPRRTSTFLFSHKSWSTTSKTGHMHWSRIAPSASTKVMSPLEGPSPGLEALGTLEIHIHDLLSISAFSIRSKGS